MLLTKNVVFFKKLPWLGIEIYVSNISISFYRNIVSKNIFCDMGLTHEKIKICFSFRQGIDMLSAPILFVLSSITFVSTVYGFCTPTDACWPSKAEVESFVANLSKADNGCLPTIPVFASLDKPGDPIANPWYDDQVNTFNPLLFYVSLRDSPSLLTYYPY